MIDAGYFVKRVELRPHWLQASGVLEICSVSNCISRPPEGWIDRWLHNELGWFNRIADAMSVVPAGQQERYRLFAYRVYPEVFRPGGRAQFSVPADVRPEPMPASFRSLGFDTVSKSMEATLGFECSPLSCNYMALECAVNECCLFWSLEDALAGADRFAAEQSAEPGDYYVMEVLEDRQAAAGERQT